MILCQSWVKTRQSKAAHMRTHSKTQARHRACKLGDTIVIEALLERMRGFTLERKDHLPIILHADDRPPVLECEQEITEETEKQFSARVGAHGVHEEKTELSNLFSLFSPFPPVECLSWLECKNLLPIILHADDGPTVLLRLVI